MMGAVASSITFLLTQYQRDFIELCPLLKSSLIREALSRADSEIKLKGQEEACLLFKNNVWYCWGNVTVRCKLQWGSLFLPIRGDC